MAESVENNSIEYNSIETSNLNKQQFRLNKVNEIKDYFVVEIRLSKHIASLNTLINL